MTLSNWRLATFSFSKLEMITKLFLQIYLHLYGIGRRVALVVVVVAAVVVVNTIIIIIILFIYFFLFFFIIIIIIIIIYLFIYFLRPPAQSLQAKKLSYNGCCNGRSFGWKCA